MQLRKREIVPKKNLSWPSNTLKYNKYVLIRIAKNLKMKMLIGLLVMDATNGSTISASVLTLKWQEIRTLNITVAPVKLNVLTKVKITKNLKNTGSPQKNLLKAK